jgi:RNA polymerase sigma-70 factor (ECF subfamily)
VSSLDRSTSPGPVEDADRIDTERHLLARIRKGDRGAAEELVERTYTGVFAALSRLCGDADLASDLTQETYRKAWSSLGGFNGRAQLSTWLYRIAYTTFLNHVRRPARTTSIDDEKAPELRDKGKGAYELVSESEEAARLRRAVLALPLDLQFMVTAHFWAGLSIAELAAAEGVSGVAIRKRLHRAFALIERELEQGGGR